ncbi:hypothetical protein AOQ84DRAFT_392345 [Glonium stellatum]|uniref:Zn(2)-C6 fungal-type domain-containing protein n=1 Tax=Glonium stellatum TaxID=574774 RepID=A0A8E2ER17_9PEZI|nr:hypothetical protein AOQ84DRAFT_392345 [Glonium stellatum]
MSLPGRPTSACNTCRRKKVKCDQTTPRCRRCLSKGLRCEGYAGNTKLDTKFVIRSSSGSSCPSYPAAGSPVPSIAVSLEHQAIPRFFSDYVHCGSSPGVPGGHLYFLYELFDDDDEVTPYLSEALTATAYASLANQLNLESLRIKARLVYGRSLTLVNQALGNASEAIKDATLGTIILFGLYEFIMNDGSKPYLWDVHHNGRMLLLQLRGSGQLNTSRGQAMFRMVYMTMQSAYLVKYWYPPKDIVFPELLNEGALPKVGFPMDRSLANPVTRVIRLCATTIDLLRHSGSRPILHELQNVVQEAALADVELLQWKKNAPIAWKYKSVTVTPLQRAQLPEAFPNWLKQFEIYADFRMAWIWNFHRSVRLLLHHAVLCCLNRLKSSPDWSQLCTLPDFSWDAHAEVVAAMVDEICGSVPFSLGQIVAETALNALILGLAPLGGYLALYPLHCARTRGRLNDRKFDYVNGVLRLIRDGLGIKHAQNILDWPFVIAISGFSEPRRVALL